MSDQSVSRGFFNISAAILCLSLAVCAVICTLQVLQTGSAVASHFNEAAAGQKLQREQVTAIADLFSDMGCYAAARGLQEAGMMSPAEANALAADAVKSISEKSERWGKIAKAIHESLERQQREAEIRMQQMNRGGGSW